MNDKCQCGQAHSPCATEFQYAVKLVCGEVRANTEASTPVAPGRYWTAINIHNPDKCHDAHFRWKVVDARQGGQGSDPVYQKPRVLRPDRALEIDCQQVMNTSQPFVKGYVVIESDIELDVVAVYTGATSGSNNISNSFHTERVQPRCVPVCEDLILPLHTGFADWQTVAPTVGGLGSVVPVSPSLNWIAPPFGSQYVSQSIADVGPNSAVSTRFYELCFDLCFGFTVPAPFKIQVVVDDTAKVFLNGTLITPVVTYNVLKTLVVNPGSLRNGRNCFRVEVANTGRSTAFALAGFLHVIRGKCPCSSLPIAVRVRTPLAEPLPETESSSGTVSLKPPSDEPAVDN